MDKDEMLKKEYAELMEKIEVSEETKNLVLNMTGEEAEVSKAAKKTGRMTKLRVMRVAIAACLVIAVTGLGTLGVRALNGAQPMPAYFPQNASLEEDDRILAPGETALEGEEYTISYEGLIYDDELNVGYVSLFAGRNDGQPMTDADNYAASLLSTYWSRGSVPQSLCGLFYGLQGIRVSAGDEQLYVFMDPVLSMSTFYYPEDGGKRQYLKFRVDGDHSIVLEKSGEVIPVSVNNFTMTVLTGRQLEEIGEKAEGLESEEEIRELLCEYNMSEPEYVSAYLHTVSNDVLTAKIGRTDTSLEWRLGDVDSVMIIRENGTEIEAVRDGKPQWTYRAGENVPMGETTSDNIQTMIVPYGDILREGEDVQIIVDGELLK